MCQNAKSSECHRECKNAFGPTDLLEIIKPAVMKRKTFLEGYVNCPFEVLRIGNPEVSRNELPAFLKQHCIEAHKLTLLSTR